MADANESVGLAKSANRTDLWLNAVVVLLVLGLLALAGWFGYSVWQDRQVAELTNAPTRVVEALKTQVRKAPNDVVLRVRLGEALGAAKQYPEAVEQLNQALKIDPKHVGAHLDLGMISLLTKNETAAERYLKKVVELTDQAQYNAVDERRESALYNLGLLKLEQKKYEEAAGYFKGALRIRKDASDTYVALSQALEGMGDVDGALQNLEIALQFDPGFATAHYRMGLLYRQKKDDVNSSYHFYQAAKHAPDAPETQEALEAFGASSDWVARAKKAQSAGDIQKALQQVLVATNLDPENAATAKLHASILEERGDFGDALDVYIRAQSLNPKDQTVKAQISRLEREHPDDALKTYQVRLKAEPSDKALKAKVAELKKATKAK